MGTEFSSSSQNRGELSSFELSSLQPCPEPPVAIGHPSPRSPLILTSRSRATTKPASRTFCPAHACMSRRHCVRRPTRDPWVSRYSCLIEPQRSVRSTYTRRTPDERPKCISISSSASDTLSMFYKRRSSMETSLFLGSVLMIPK